MKTLLIRAGDWLVGRIATAGFTMVLERHSPVEVYSDRSSGPICRSCRPVASWPCDDAVDAQEAIARLRGARRG